MGTMKSFISVALGITVGVLLFQWIEGKIHFPPLPKNCMTLEQYRASQQTPHPNCVVIPVAGADK
jgi:hypothetical protein